MNDVPINPGSDRSDQSFDTICQSLGLAKYRLDLNGQLIADPESCAQLKIWLCSPPIRSLLTECAQFWASQDALDPIAHECGLVLFPMVNTHRDRRSGLTVFVGFTEQVLDDPILTSALNDPLSLNAARHAVRRLVRPWDKMVRETCTLLSRIRVSDSQHEHDAELIESYTAQLSDSYEVIAALHMLGREMGRVDNAHAFLDLSADMIAATLDYAWIGYLLEDDEGAFIQHGEVEMDEQAVRAHLTRLELEQPITVCDGVVVYDANGMFFEYGPQVLVHPLRTSNRRFRTIVVCGKRGEDNSVSTHDTKTIDSIAGIVASFLESLSLYREQRQTFLGFIGALSATIDAKDPYTQGHSERVAALAEQLARAVGYNEERAVRVRLCGTLHDIGKIGVPEDVLCKDSRLTDEEFEIIKTHPGIGARVLKGIPSMDDIIPGVLHHHERWDGRGYPEGLSGEDIPEVARILALADTFDAMSSNRSYRSARSRDEVFEEIRRNAGTQFDPSLVDPFLALDFSRYDDMVKGHKAQAPKRKAA